MAGQTGAGAMSRGNAGPGESPEQLPGAAGSPAATQADLYQMQQRMGAAPIFGQQGAAGAQAAPQARIDAIKKMLAGGGAGAAEGGTTRVRRRAQPVMGAGALG